MFPAKITKLKLLAQILVCILVVDCIFILYKFRSYHSAANQRPIQINELSEGRLQYLAKFVKNDQILTAKQANSIINTEHLNVLQSTVQRNEEATTTVLFLKTHKTGSSTLQNIVLRHALIHNLTIALPAFKASFFWPWRFRSEVFVKERPGIRRYQTFAHHAVFSEESMREVMRLDVEFITILREPVSLFRSAFKYYNMQKYCFNTTVDDIAYSANYSVLRNGLCPKTHTPVRNLQAFDLGLSPDQMDNKSAVHELIKQIDSVMKIVLITERFDESLILLKKKFQWTLEDIVYFRQNAQKSQNKRLSDKRTESADASILEFNYADSLIYDHFSRRLDRELREEFTENQLSKELKGLRNLQAINIDRCVDKLATASSVYFTSKLSPHLMFRPYGAHTQGYVLKRESLQDVHCRLMAMPELSLTHFLKATR